MAIFTATNHRLIRKWQPTHPPLLFLSQYLLFFIHIQHKTKTNPEFNIFSGLFHHFPSMKRCNFSWVFFSFFLFVDSLSSHLLNSTAEFQGYTAISDFRVINRRELGECPDPNPYLEVNISSNSTLSNEEYVTVTVSGVLLPSESDWVGMISPSHSE